ncbi:MAG: DUF2721 domain-containing protein [Spirochaetes bacterium]|nr:DUF2721 domain-containing protein [Spirochaetota bacterium]MBU0956568.1 DUF2721 domain-containing protein [Spirochaetota bacterium]
MEFNLSTPALLFSAISLLLLAYTNRFLAIAALIRQFIKLYEEKPEDKILRQINHFKLRLRLIKFTQIFGVLSFIICVFCMFLIMLGQLLFSELVFSVSLLVLMASLLTSLIEVMISINALNIEIDSVQEKT